MAESIAEFLVCLDWRTDVASENRFTIAILNAATNAIKLTAALEAAGVAATKAVEKIASHFESLSYSSERLNTPILNIKAFAFALSQVGSTAEEATALLESFGEKLRKSGTEFREGGRQGALERTIQGWGAVTRDERGRLLALDKILESLVKSEKFRREEYYIQRQQWEALGGSESSLMAMQRDHARYADDYRRKAQAFGLDMEKAGEGARQFERAWRGVWETIQLLIQKFGADFEERLASKLRAFDDWLTTHGPGIVAGVEAVYDVVERLASAIVTTGGAIYDFFHKALDPWFEKTTSLTQATERFTGALAMLAGAAGIGALASAISQLVYSSAFGALSAGLGAIGLGGGLAAAGALTMGGAAAVGAIQSRGGVGPWVDKVKKDWGPGGRVWHPGTGGGGPGILGGPAQGTTPSPEGQQGAPVGADGSAVEKMMQLEGLHRYPPAERAKLREFLRNGGDNLDPATTAWCAATVSSALTQAGYKVPQQAGHGTDWVPDYNHWGADVGAGGHVRADDVVIMNNDHHVGLATGRETPTQVETMEGNTGGGGAGGNWAHRQWRNRSFINDIRRATAAEAPPPRMQNPKVLEGMQAASVHDPSNSPIGHDGSTPKSAKSITTSHNVTIDAAKAGSAKEIAREVDKQLRENYHKDLQGSH